MKPSSLFVLSLLAGCAAQQGAPTIAVVAPRAETAPPAHAQANAAALVRTAAGETLILGAAESDGVEFYTLTGERLGAAHAGAVAGIDARVGVPGGAADSWIVAALDGAANRLRLFAYENGGLRDITAREIPIGFAGESLCLYRDARDRNLYAFALGGDGQIAQFILFADNGRVDARLARQFQLASEVSYCVADDATGDLYVAEQAVGVWRFGANPETDVTPEIIDIVRLGRITEEVGGLALHGAYLIASNASANSLHVYDRAQDHRFAGAFQVGADAETVRATAGLYATDAPLGPRLPNGALIATDEANAGGANFKLIAWEDIAAALRLAPMRAARAAPALATVSPSAETTPVETDGDAADDPAIWPHPRDPALSLIIGTQKQSGLYVYDLNGAVLQFLPDGRMNNVDVRDGFSLGGVRTPVVAASNRTNRSIALYRIDAATRRLINIADGVQPTGFVDPYGLCLYRSAASNRLFVFVNDTEGAMKQWELIDTGQGRVRAELVRAFAFSSQAEGCVADDAAGALYVAEEDVGLWRMSAEPDGGDARTMIAAIAGNPALKDDLEGVGLYDLGGGRGYLIVSSQGNNSYAVFRREGDNAYLGSFAVVADGARGIDGASETDGLDVSSVSLGGGYSHGLFVAQDGRNISPPQNQNFKLVPWSEIAQAIGLAQR